MPWPDERVVRLLAPWKRSGFVLAARSGAIGHWRILLWGEVLAESLALSGQ